MVVAAGRASERWPKLISGVFCVLVEDAGKLSTSAWRRRTNVVVRGMELRNVNSTSSYRCEVFGS